MLAMREQLEPIHTWSDPRFGERPQWHQFPASVAGHETKSLTPPQDVDAPRQVVPKPGRKAKPESKQSTPSDNLATSSVPTAKLRLATHCILVALARIAFADIRDVFDDHGAVIPFGDLPPAVRAAIAEYRVRRSRNGNSSVRVRLHSKLPALAALGRHLGVFRCRPERVLPQVATYHSAHCSPQPVPGIGF
jgi:hypothetical protein